MTYKSFRANINLVCFSNCVKYRGETSSCVALAFVGIQLVTSSQAFLLDASADAAFVQSPVQALPFLVR